MIIFTINFKEKLTSYSQLMSLRKKVYKTQGLTLNQLFDLEKYWTSSNICEWPQTHLAERVWLKKLGVLAIKILV